MKAALLALALAACGDNLPAPAPDAAPAPVDADAPDTTIPSDDAALPSCTALGCPGSSSCFSPTVCVCSATRCEPT